MKKRFLALLLAVMLLVSTFAFTASASSEDGNYEIHVFTPNAVASNTYAARIKQNTTSSYISYKNRVGGGAASGPNQYEAQIWGSELQNTGFVDCSSYTEYGVARTKAIITLGTEGLMRQDVFERFGSGSYAQIYGAMISETGIALGCWSADSIDYGYNHYNRIP